MQTVLTIDHGNSSVKMHLYRDGELVSSLRSERAEATAVAEAVSGYGDFGIIYCAVGRVDRIFLEELALAYPGRTLVMDSATPLPIGIGYRSRATLGLDRVAAAVGAHRLYGGERLLVADAGTAMTLDIVESDGTFAGGNISAGIGLRLKSLHQFTARLPLVETDGDLPRYGYDTATAIRCGAVDGALGELIWLAEREDCHRIILTGGDAPLLEERLKKETNIPAIRRDDLVSQGLLRIYEYNETN